MIKKYIYISIWDEMVWFVTKPDRENEIYASLAVQVMSFSKLIYLLFSNWVLLWLDVLDLDAYWKSLLFTRVWAIIVGFLFCRTDGIGLSAPQVGINVRLMVFNPVGERGEGEEIVLVNPRVNKYSKKVVLFNEGCLSFPGIYADVEVFE